MAYRVHNDGLWGGIITDLGSVTPLVLNKMRSLSLLVLEFNYDPKMLFEGKYTYSVKQRVASMQGHLSNQQAEDLLVQIASPRLQQLVAAHISERNNTFGLVKRHISSGLRRAGAIQDINVHLAEQNSASPLFSLSAMFVE